MSSELRRLQKEFADYRKRSQYEMRRLVRARLKLEAETASVRDEAESVRDALLRKSILTPDDIEDAKPSRGLSADPAPVDSPPANRGV